MTHVLKLTALMWIWLLALSVLFGVFGAGARAAYISAPVVHDQRNDQVPPPVGDQPPQANDQPQANTVRSPASETPAQPVMGGQDTGSKVAGFLAGDLGISTANQDVGTGLGWGAELGFFPTHPSFGIGALYRGANHGTPKTNIYGLEFILRPADAFSIGLVAGFGSLSQRINNNDVSDSAFAYGGKLGYDWRLGNTIFTLGAELDWLLFKPQTSTISVVDALGTFKIWL